jgi:MFS transporter, DHA3 family, macrolide efflux protein
MSQPGFRDMLRHPGSLTYVRVWVSQMLSSVGSEMTSFALAVYLYQQTGQATTLAITLAFATLPRALATLVAGGVVDRSDRRRVIMLAELAQAAALIALLTLVNTHRLEAWMVWIAVAITSAAATFQNIATSATISLLVPKEHLPRANGLQSIADGAQTMAGPALGGVLFGLFGLTGVLLIDFLTYLVNLANLVDLSIPNPPLETRPKRISILEDARVGWGFIRSRPGLFGLLGLWIAWNLIVTTSPLYRSVVLANTGNNATTLGFIEAAVGIGSVLGGLLMTAWGGPKRLIYGVLGGVFFMGLLGPLLLGFAQSVPLWFIGNLLPFLFLPMYFASMGAIFQRKVPPELQGRVFAMRRMISIIGQPIVLFAVGPLTDQVFNPLMTGPLGDQLAPLFGMHAARGASLMLVLVGLVLMIVPALTLLNSRVRKLEDEIPDATVQT